MCVLKDLIFNFRFNVSLPSQVIIRLVKHCAFIYMFSRVYPLVLAIFDSLPNPRIALIRMSEA